MRTHFRSCADQEARANQKASASEGAGAGVMTLGVSYVITTLLERYLNDRFQTDYPIIVCEKAYVQPDRIVTIATYLHYQAAYVAYAPSKLTTLEIAHQLETRLAPYINKIKELEDSEPTLVIEPLVGWHIYRFDNHELRSWARDLPLIFSSNDGWSDTAICILGKCHKSPAITCTCGYYAMSDSEKAFETMTKLRASCISILAKVEAKGTIIRHQEGWRAEYIRPVRFELMNLAKRDEFLEWAGANVPEAEIVL